MPALTTLAQLLVMNSMGVSDAEISNIFQEAPFLSSLAAAPSSNGTVHKWLRTIGAPDVGFRAVNTGVATSVAEQEHVSADLKILSANVEVDQQIAKNFNHAVYGKGVTAYMAFQGMANLKSALSKAELQFFNGGSGGFSGLKDALNVLGDAAKLVVSAGGSAANACTSIYAIRSTDDLADVVAVGGDMTGSGAFELQAGEITDSKIVTSLGPPELSFPSYRMNQEGYIGLQVGSLYSIARACNISQQSHVTAELLEDLLDKARSDRPFTAIAMNRRTGRWLARNLKTPEVKRVELLTEFEGVPIVYTSNILNTEAVVTT